jgi:hypothetical protein
MQHAALAQQRAVDPRVRGLYQQQQQQQQQQQHRMANPHSNPLGKKTPDCLFLVELVTTSSTNYPNNSSVYCVSKVELLNPNTIINKSPLYCVSDALTGAAGRQDGGSGGGGLSKFFSADMLRQQLPNMPPLPPQGQRVLTVDEIERRQQTVTH